MASKVDNYADVKVAGIALLILYGFTFLLVNTVGYIGAAIYMAWAKEYTKRTILIVSSVVGFVYFLRGISTSQEMDIEKISVTFFASIAAGAFIFGFTWVARTIGSKI